MAIKNVTTDSTAPTLTSLVVPKVIDLGAGAAQFSISAVATDDLSGVKQVLVWFDREFAYSYSLTGQNFSSTNLLGMFGTSDSWEDGASASTWAIAATNPSGIYNITHIDVVDQQGNSRAYYQSELISLGINTAINFKSSTADTAAPTLTSLVIPGTVDLSQGTAQFSISAVAADDLSGVKQVLVWFDREFAYSYSLTDQNFSSTNLLGMFGTSDSWEDGASSNTWAIAATNPSGSYNITHIDVVDQQGNSRAYYQSELKSLGFNTAVNFKTMPDVEEPAPIQRIEGTDADDILHSSAGWEEIDGRDGIDAVLFNGNRADYVIQRQGESTYALSTEQGYEGTLFSIERLQFSDRSVALDLLPSQAAGKAALLIGALAGTAAIRDQHLFGEALNFIDLQGSQAATWALVQNGTVAALAGGTGDAELLALLWRNLVRTEATQEEIDGLLVMKQALGLDQAQVLDFAMSLELAAESVDLVGLSQHGVEYFA